MMNIKKLLCRMLVFSLMVVSVGCRTPSSSESSTDWYSDNSYITADVLDSDGSVLYSSFTELDEIPILNLKEDYFLEMHIFPGARLAPYEYTTITVDESAIHVREITERSGELYILQGMKTCENIKLEIEFLESISKDITLTCCVYISFS